MCERKREGENVILLSSLQDLQVLYFLLLPEGKYWVYLVPSSSIVLVDRNCLLTDCLFHGQR